VRSVPVVQVTRDNIVDVSRVRHGFVTALFAVHVRSFVPVAIVTGRTIGRVRRACGKFVLVDVSFVRVMQMTIVRVIGVIAMFHGRVPAGDAVNVLVLLMNGVGHSAILPKNKRKTTMRALGART
jgi:hypothetical protein